MDGKTKLSAGILAILALFMAAAVPMMSDESCAEEVPVEDSSIYVVYTEDPVPLSAGSSATVTIHIYNRDSVTHSVVVKASCTGEISASVSGSGLISVSAGSLSEVIITLSASEYCAKDDYTLSFTVTVLTALKASGTFTKTVVVSSSLSSDEYNKFLGYFENNFSGIWGSVWFTAAVSVFGLLAIGYAVMFVGVNIVTGFFMRKKSDRKRIKKLLYRLCQIAVWMWMIGKVLNILGASERVIDFTDKVFSVAFVVVCVIAGWQLYKMVIDMLIKNAVAKADEYEIDAVRTDFESFRPLFFYIGEIVLAIALVVIVMGLLNVDVAAIITSAGLVSLGISMGAQDVLKQFFSGLEILTTRPFKTGDLIKVGSDPTIYRVRKVNVMNTLLENWDNTDINILPNSTITTSNIRNITKDTIRCKVYLSVEVAYGTDVNLARNLLQEAAVENAHVITDGSVGRPYTRLDEFGDSNLIIKMGFYVDDFNNQYSVSGQIRQAIIDKFEKNGINIDYQMVVFNQGEPEEPGVTLAKLSPVTPEDKKQ